MPRAQGGGRRLPRAAAHHEPPRRSDDAILAPCRTTIAAGCGYGGVSGPRLHPRRLPAFRAPSFHSIGGKSLVYGLQAYHSVNLCLCRSGARAALGSTAGLAAVGAHR